MEKDKEIQMKQHVLSMLHDFMLGEDGGKFKPNAIKVDMIGEPKIEPIGGKVKDWQKTPEDSIASLDDDFRAEHDEPMDEEDEEDGKKPKMSLKDFLASR